MQGSGVTILYDNRADGGLRPGWGFAAFIRTEGAVVMLDTGADKLVLEHNARELGCDLDVVTALALSHEHCDHIGAISSVLHKGLHLYVPAAVAKRFAGVHRQGIEITPVKGPTEIVPGVRSIGQLGRRRIPEQALLVDGNEGPVLLTGCAHPGIADMVRRATDIVGRSLSMVLGGFHLLRKEDGEVRRTVEGLLKLDVGRIAPCHCTGEKAIDAMREVFKERFLDIRVGSRIAL
jgi:7,8-dihydropterin-6-yl-methyl-4-(beta-D-ribofuranosyl)aminobenzene 5'-phosphate synthase